MKVLSSKLKRGSFRGLTHRAGRRVGVVLMAGSLALAAATASAQTAAYSNPRGAPSWLAASHAQALGAPNQGGAPQLTPPIIPQLETDLDPSGAISSYQPGGATTTANNAFFQSLGTNGRTCFTCHQPQNDWSFTPSNAVQRYNKSGGSDPLFRMVDGANCPSDDPFQRSSFSEILNRAVNRIFLPLPNSAQFTVSVADDPTGCETDPKYGIAASGDVSVYRRPLPASNLIFLNLVNSSPRLHCLPLPTGLGTTGYTGSMTAGSTTLTLTTAPERTLFVGQQVLVVGAGTVNPPNGGINLNLLQTTVAGVTSPTVYTLAAAAVNTVNGIPVNTKGAAAGQLGISEDCENIMWDGREPDLISQFTDATLIHAQGASAPTAIQSQQGVNFQSGMFTAQSADWLAGSLSANGATGGVLPLPALYPDGQDSVAGTSHLTTFDIFDGWSNITGPNFGAPAKRASIARGQSIFNNVVMDLSGVAGFNNLIGPGEHLKASCNTCHNIKNVGGEVLLHVVNTGVASGAFVAHPNDLPLFTVTCTSGAVCQPTQPGETCYDTSSGGPPYPPLQSLECSPESPCVVTTDDPGRALISGNCSDIGSFKTPTLRGIVGRPPFFHDGSAATLNDVVYFYNKRFPMCVPPTGTTTCTPEVQGLNPQNVTDLTNFLGSL
jgi:hypothetical protein